MNRASESTGKVTYIIERMVNENKWRRKKGYLEWKEFSTKEEATVAESTSGRGRRENQYTFFVVEIEKRHHFARSWVSSISQNKAEVSSQSLHRQALFSQQ